MFRVPTAVISACLLWVRATWSLSILVIIELGSFRSRVMCLISVLRKPSLLPTVCVATVVMCGLNLVMLVSLLTYLRLTTAELTLVSSIVPCWPVAGRTIRLRLWVLTLV